MTILASLLALAPLAFAGFSTTAGAAALKQPYAPAGASGVDNNAPPPGTEPLAPGLWDAQNYRILHHAASCPQPPQSAAARFALDNSPIMLTYFGLPSLALYGGNIVKWQNVVLHTQHRACDTSTPILNGHTIANSNITYGPSWSGFGNQCNGYICYNMEGADYQFLVPSIDRASTYEAVSHWVGVGGANGDALAQTGVFESTYNWLNTEETFYESEGCNGTPGGMQTGYTVNTNDSMYFFANWQGSEYMDDYTSNTYEAKVWGCGANDGAEFITERISNSGGGRWKLANFHKIIAHYAEFEDSNGSWHDLYYVGPFGGGIYQWVLQNPQYQYMITFPSWPVSDTGYGSTWESDFVRGT